MSSEGEQFNGSAHVVPSTAVSRREWDSFVDTSPQGSIYCKCWWLDAVCPDAYELTVIRKDGVIRAGMALPITRHRGRVIVRMPPLTQTLGPLLCQPRAEKYGTQLTYEMKMLRELIATLPRTDEFFINCSPEFNNWLPFHWAGYSQTTRYSYELDLTDLRMVYDGMSDKNRNIIRKAERAGIRIEECDDLGSVFGLFKMTYSRQGLEFPHEWALIERLDRGAIANAGRRIFLARDGAGRIHAGIYVIYTPERTYYVMQGSDPQLRASGAPLLLHWHAIQFAATVSQRYDFVGSMLENVERAFRSFGAVQRPYFSIFSDQPRITFREFASMGKKLLLRSFTSVIALVTCEWQVGVTSDAVGTLTQLV